MLNQIDSMNQINSTKIEFIIRKKIINSNLSPIINLNNFNCLMIMTLKVDKVDKVDNKVDNILGTHLHTNHPNEFH